jgi:hypothetical protein
MIVIAMVAGALVGLVILMVVVGRRPVAACRPIR